MPFHAAHRRAVGAALNQPQVGHHTGIQLECGGIERHRRRGRILIQKHSIDWVNPKSQGVESCRFPVPCVLVLLPVGAEQTDAQARIQSEPASNLPVVLEIRFSNLVALVVTALRRILSKALNVSRRSARSICDRFNQEVGEGVPRTVGEVAESQQPLQVTRSRTDGIVSLIALGVDVLSPELQSMSADCFAHIVARGVGWIGMAPGHIGWVRRETLPAIRGIRAQKVDSGHLSAKTVIENVADGAFRKTGGRVDAEYRVALSGS